MAMLLRVLEDRLRVYRLTQPVRIPRYRLPLIKYPDLFLSIGGNNALGFQSVTYAPASSVGEALLKIEEIQRQFQGEYHNLIKELVDLKLPLTVCNIYNPNYSGEELKVAKTGNCYLHIMCVTFN